MLKRIRTINGQFSNEDLNLIAGFLNKLDGQEVNVDFNSARYSPPRHEEDFYGFIDREEIGIGNSDCCPTINMKYVESVQLKEDDRHLQIIVILDDKSSVQAYNLLM